MGKKAMKRYHFIIDTAYDWSDTSSAELAFENAFIREEEYPDGTWVKWDDVQELVDALKESRLVVDGVCEEYRGYYVTLHKIDNVLNKIEGTK